MEPLPLNEFKILRLEPLKLFILLLDVYPYRYTLKSDLMARWLPISRRRE